MATTRIPQVVAKLAEIYAATGLQVVDGPHLGELMDEAIVIGFTQSVDQAGYSTDVERLDGFGAPRYRENFEVVSLITVASGETDVAALRNRCGDVLGQIDLAVRDAVVVAGVWDRAGVTGATQWIPLQDQQGAAMNVIFSVAGSCLL